VAVVIEALGRGGAERLLVDSARWIDRSRFSLRVYTLFESRRDYAEELRDLSIPETCLRLGSLRDLWTGVRRLRALLASAPADIVHTHLFSANAVGRCAARLQGTPVISSYHDADYEPVVRLGNSRLTARKQALLQLTDRLTARLSNAHAVAVSAYVAGSLRRRLGFPAQRISTILNGVDTTVFCPDPEQRERKRCELGLSTEEPVVLCVGRMTPQKGQATLLRALCAARPAQARLLFAGDGPERDGLERLAHDLGLGARVAFLGTRPDVPDLLRAADVLALPSLHEGFGLVVAEALATGIPVVASRVGPLPEILRHGETGFLVASGDPGQLSASLTELLSRPDLRREMAAHSRADAIARFEVRSMVAELERLYERLVA
jgi:glycosyltransferase involved in cell wall biosynthesis